AIAAAAAIARAAAAPAVAAPLSRRGSAIAERELAARDDHGGAADLDQLDLLTRALDPRTQLRGTPDLGALGDLDLLAELDRAVASQVQRERPGGGTGRRVLGDSDRGCEHARLPVGAGAGEAAHVVAAERGQGSVVGRERRNGRLVLERDVDVVR